MASTTNACRAHPNSEWYDDIGEGQYSTLLSAVKFSLGDMCILRKHRHGKHSGRALARRLRRPLDPRQ